MAGKILSGRALPPIASVVTLGDVEAIAFPATAISRIILEHPEFGRRLKHAAISRITGR